MTAAADFCVAFDVQAAIRDILTVWPGLSGVDIATGPRRKEPNEGVVIARPRATSSYRGAYRSEEGTVSIIADAFVAGAAEETIDAARARAKAILNECVAALSLGEQTGGDITADGLLLSIGSEIQIEEADSYIEEPGARIAGHGYTISATLTYTARIVSPGGS